MHKIVSLIILSCLLTSCSWVKGNQGIIQNRETDYLNARSIPPLKIPPGLSSSSIQASYPVPDRNYPRSKEDINLLPPGL